MRKKNRLTNGFHVWNQEWPHEVSTEINPKEAELMKDADLKYQGLYYQELL